MSVVSLRLLVVLATLTALVLPNSMATSVAQETSVDLDLFSAWLLASRSSELLLAKLKAFSLKAPMETMAPLMLWAMCLVLMAEPMTRSLVELWDPMGTQGIGRTLPLVDTRTFVVLV